MFKYIPYNGYKEANRLGRLIIPSDVQSLDGYGQGVDDAHYNYVEWNEEIGTVKYIKNVAKYSFTDSVKEKWNINQSSGSFIQFSTNTITFNKDPKKGAIFINNKGFKVHTVSGYDNVLYSSRFSNIYNTFLVSLPAGTTLEDWLAKLEEWANEGDPFTLVYELDEPEVIDITGLIYADNLIPVEPYGTITAVNEYQYPVPTSITYQLKQTTATEEEPV